MTPIQLNESAACDPVPAWRVRRHAAAWLAVAMLALFPAVGSGQAPANDDFAAAATLAGGGGVAVGGNVNASAEPGEPEHADNQAEASVWWQWTALSSGPVAFDTLGSDFDTVLAVYTGSSLGDLILVADNDDLDEEFQSLVMFEAVAGTTYRIVVDGFDGELGRVALRWVQLPLNDQFSAAAVLAGPTGITFGSNVEMTREPGEPDHAGGPGGASAWWEWTAPADGPVVFDTYGSDFSTVLAVYTGDAIGALTEVASDADFDLTGQSMVAFAAVAGTTYRIAVDGIVWEDELDASMGTIVLNWGPPLPNDDFDDAIVIAGLTGGTTGRNRGATMEPGEPDPIEKDLGGASVWWQWTPSESGVITFDTFGSDFDTLLAVFTGESVEELVLVADNDDSGDDFQSLVSFAVMAGTTYRIAVHGYEGETGGIALNWSWTAVPAEELTLTNPTRLANGAFGFLVQGPPGSTGSIQRSNAVMQAWEDWKPFTLGGSPLEVIDPEAGSGPARFYRAVSP